MDPKDIVSVYANILNIRLTPNELVLEFGAHFPDGPAKAGEKISFPPNARIIMPAGSVESLHQAIGQALKIRDQMVAQISVATPAKAQ